MGADTHNISRYVTASFTRKLPGVVFSLTKSEKDTEPALHFRFDKGPNNLTKGFVLGSDNDLYDALNNDPRDNISQEMFVFTFNKYHQLIMYVKSAERISV